jgi:hypothetical protein
MSCKLKIYKKKEDGKQCEKPFCKFLNGECQFVEDGSEKSCPIHGVHKDA